MTAPNDSIKNVVRMANEIISSFDTTFIVPENREKIDSIVRTLNRDFKTSQILAAYIIRYLKEEGYSIDTLEGDIYDTFRRKYGNILDSLSTVQLDQVKKINNKLFEQLRT